MVSKFAFHLPPTSLRLDEDGDLIIERKPKSNNRDLVIEIGIKNGNLNDVRIKVTCYRAQQEHSTGVGGPAGLERRIATGGLAHTPLGDDTRAQENTRTGFWRRSH